MFTEIFNLYFIYFTFHVMLQVTLFTMAGLAIMPFYVNRLKSEICFFMKKTPADERVFTLGGCWRFTFSWMLMDIALIHRSYYETTSLSVTPSVSAIGAAWKQICDIVYTAI